MVLDKKDNNKYHSVEADIAPEWMNVMVRNTFPDADLSAFSLNSTKKFLSLRHPRTLRNDATLGLAIGYFSTGSVLVTAIANRSKDGLSGHMAKFIKGIEKEARKAGADILTIVAGKTDPNLYFDRGYSLSPADPPAYTLNLVPKG